MLQNKIILHIDMNSYFASVEQQANPFLRGKPVGVCAYISKNGCIIASSKEAKKVGIATGCRIRDALEKDPQVVLVQNDPSKYRTVTQKLFAILNEYTTNLEPYSIDEAFLDITGIVGVRAQPHVMDKLQIAHYIGEEINMRVKREIGEWLTCSIGISYTRFLAKLLSDTGPKDAVSVCAPDDITNLLNTLQLTDIWGINRRLELQFNNMGINTPLELYHADPAVILSALHRPGYFLWAGLHGREVSQSVAAREHPKSIGHSYCMPKKTTDKKYLAHILMKLCEKTGRRMREKQFDARLIHVYWRYTKGGGGRQSIRLYAPIYDSIDIFNHAWLSIQESVLTDTVSMLAVSVSDFSPAKDQQTLFQSFDAQSVKRRSLLGAMDAINDKHGEYTVIRGAMWGTDKNAPDRIGFRKTVSWES